MNPHRTRICHFPYTLYQRAQLYTHVAIVATRQVQHNHTWRQQFLVRWDGPIEDSWEFTDDLHRLAPSLNLEDKVPLHEGVL